MRPQPLPPSRPPHTGPRRADVTLLVLLLAAFAEAFFAAVLLDPSGVLGSVAAASTVDRHDRDPGHRTAWPWVALLAVVLLLVAAVGGTRSGREHGGASAPLQKTPAAARTTRPAGRQRLDRLDAGRRPDRPRRRPPHLTQ